MPTWQASRSGGYSWRRILIHQHHTYIAATCTLHSIGFAIVYARLVESESVILEQSEAAPAARAATTDVIYNVEVVEVPQAAPRGAAGVDLPAGTRVAGGAIAAVEEEVGRRRHWIMVLQEVVHVRHIPHHRQVVVVLRRRRCWPCCCFICVMASRAVAVVVRASSAVVVLDVALVLVVTLHDLAALLEEARPGALDVLGRRLALLEVRPPVVLDLVVRPAGEATRNRRPSGRRSIITN